MKNIESVLKLNKIVFDKIEFNRLGFKNDKELEFEIQSNISQKPEEYTLEISLSGFFSVESENELTDALKNSLVVKNSVAIMMPYLRSQVSLVTAQPEVECVVLPAFNINKMLDNE